MEKHNFQRYTLDEDYKKEDIKSIRFNSEERLMVNTLMHDLGIDSEGTALKTLLRFHYGYVLHTQKIVEGYIKEKLLNE